MKFPLQITYTRDMTCRGIFPDYPDLMVEGETIEITLCHARQILSKTISDRLQKRQLLKSPSPIRLGQYLIEIPYELSAEVHAFNMLNRMRLQKILR